ncbi:MAG: tetratricopeptide repeat protein [Deltaproteobacteria bacterium]|nr:tetratricopeptide repeat protein [Deltaproteobacteria bacterium]
MISLNSTLKGHTADLDKTCPPGETVSRVTARLEETGLDILAETRRIDTGRLGIPVYMSLCGPAAKDVMPTRKQMGKGATPDQARASALMELVERYSFFTFWQSRDRTMTWSEAEETWPGRLMPLNDLALAAGGPMDPDMARDMLDLLDWRFTPFSNLSRGVEVQAPADFFRMLNEFNGSSAGNTMVEAALQGACEVVERHVCAVIDRTRPRLATIDPASFTDPVLSDLMAKFQAQGITVILKDFSLGLPVPTVAALAMDPGTFPDSSEIVFTAGTATDPQKACIRALTEVAQLAGDFCTASQYEASGLPKFSAPAEITWLEAGTVHPISSLPTLNHPDMARELSDLARALDRQGYPVYALDLTHPLLGIPACYVAIPGFQFRERDRHASLGMFVARKLVESHPGPRADMGLMLLEEMDPKAHYLPFCRALNDLNQELYIEAAQGFERAEAVQPDAPGRALAAFYQAYALSRAEQWEEAIPHLDRTLELDRDSREYFNLRGVCHFKAGDLEAAVDDFTAALGLDHGSAVDWANLGMCRLKMGFRDEAAEHLTRAVDLDPSLEFAWQALDEIGG